jgi:hypothetical protein
MTYEEYREVADARLAELAKRYGELMTTDRDYYDAFSRTPCEVCGRPYAGERYKLLVLNPGASPDDIAEFYVCSDCVMYVEIGTVDDYRE